MCAWWLLGRALERCGLLRLFGFVRLLSGPHARTLRALWFLGLVAEVRRGGTGSMRSSAVVAATFQNVILARYVQIFVFGLLLSSSEAGRDLDDPLRRSGQSWSSLCTDTTSTPSSTACSPIVFGKFEVSCLVTCVFVVGLGM